VAIPFEGWVGVALLAILIVTSIAAQPIRILLNGLICKLLKVPPDKIAEWALEEARKERSNPVNETLKGVAGVVAAYRGKPDAPPTEDSISVKAIDEPSEDQ
jgi:hypothetical protein